MTVLVVWPGSVISTADVATGLIAGLKAHGVNVVEYQLHGRLEYAHKLLHITHREARKRAKAAGVPFTQPKPTLRDVCYQACAGIFERIFRFRVDAVILVSGVLVPRETIATIRHAKMPVGVLLTESPYLVGAEESLAEHADVVWTNERSSVAALRRIQPHTFYLPHAWLPGRHNIAPTIEARAHDVVFVGTGFEERIALLEGVNWTGIDLGLYGNWRNLREGSPLRPFVQSDEIHNTVTAALYRRAKVGLNIYRTTTDGTGHIEHAESLNPRAYELAATGSFHLSTPRAEVSEKFNGLVPTFQTSAELDAQIRYWLTHDTDRQFVADQLPALVAEDTWIARGVQVIETLQALALVAA